MKRVRKLSFLSLEANRRRGGGIAPIEDKLATGDAVQGEDFAEFSEVPADAVDEPGVVVPDDDAVGREDFEGGLGVGFDALVRVAAVDEAEVDVVEFGGGREGEGVAAELVDVGGGGMALEGKAGGGAGETDPLAIAFAEGFGLGGGGFGREVEGVDVGLRGVEGHGEGADAAEGSCFEDLFGREGADDGGEECVGEDKAKAGEADGVDGGKDDFAGGVAAEEGGEVGVFEDGEGVAGVEGVLAGVAAKLDDVTAAFAAGEVHGGEADDVAEHGEEVAGVDLVGSRLGGRLWFHSVGCLRSAMCGFSHTDAGE